MPLDVLIVDDSAAIRKILRRVLVQAELPLGKVHEANDGREALEKMNADVSAWCSPISTCPTWTGLSCSARSNPTPA